MMTDKTDFPTPYMLVSVARIEVQQQYGGRWPEDEWVSWGPNWDINIFLSEKGRKCVTLYRRINGKAMTDSGIRLLDEKY